MSKSLKMISVFFLVSFLVGLIPIYSFAYTNYNVSVAGVFFDSTNSNDLFGDGTVGYESSSNTIVLKNAKIDQYFGTMSGEVHGIYSGNKNDLHIVLVGDNEINLFDVEEQELCNGIYSFGGLSIEGPGSLKIVCAQTTVLSNVGIWANDDIIINNLGTLSVFSGETTEEHMFSNVGIRSKEGKIQIVRPQQIEVLGYTSAFYSAPIYYDFIYHHIGNTVPKIGGTDFDSITSLNVSSYPYVCLTKKEDLSFENYNLIDFNFPCDNLDVTEDGFVDMKDVLALRKAIAHGDTIITLPAGDVNSDLSIDMKDVLFVRKYLVNPIISDLEFQLRNNDIENARKLKSLIKAMYISGDLDITADNITFYLKNGGQDITTIASEGIKTKAKWKDYPGWVDVQVSCTFDKGGVYKSSVPCIEQLDYSEQEIRNRKNDLENVQRLRNLVLEKFFLGDLDITADNTVFYLKSDGQDITTTASGSVKTNARWKEYAGWADTNVSCTFNKNGIYVSSVPNIENFVDGLLY